MALQIIKGYIFTHQNPCPLPVGIDSLPPRLLGSSRRSRIGMLWMDMWIPRVGRDGNPLQNLVENWPSLLKAVQNHVFCFFFSDFSSDFSLRIGFLVISIFAERYLRNHQPHVRHIRNIPSNIAEKYEKFEMNPLGCCVSRNMFTRIFRGNRPIPIPKTFRKIIRAR